MLAPALPLPRWSSLQGKSRCSSLAYRGSGMWPALVAVSALLVVRSGSLVMEEELSGSAWQQPCPGGGHTFQLFGCGLFFCHRIYFRLDRTANAKAVASSFAVDGKDSQPISGRVWA